MEQNDLHQRIDASGRAALSLLMGLRDSDDIGLADDELGAILAQQLAAPLPAEIPAGPGEYTPSPTFNQLLHHDTASLDRLKYAKDHAKRCRNNSQGALPKDVANVLYYASIIAALVKCGKRITTLEDRELAKGLRSIIAKPWLDHPTRMLLTEGLNVVTQGEQEG